MMEKTPGVYIEEKSAFPNSVVEVATAVPAFIGYTERATRRGENLHGVPTWIRSMLEFETVFGIGPKTVFSVSIKKATGEAELSVDRATRFLLYSSMRFYFNNGGGPCWVVSVGTYGDVESPPHKQASDFTNALVSLEDQPEPTMLVAPDAVLLDGVNVWADVANAFVAHCAKMTNRVSILDVFNGDQARTNDPKTDIISGTDEGFRHKFTAESPGYGVAYYPWLKTDILASSNADLNAIDEQGRAALKTAIEAEFLEALNTGLPKEEQNAQRARLKALTDALTAEPDTEATPDEIQANLSYVHGGLLAMSPLYERVMTQLFDTLSILPPSGGIAGVYTRIDQEMGVFKAPANIGLVSVLEPVVHLSNRDQEDLNGPLDGKAINTIRSFPDRGVLIWGARTLDGNNEDWRYINVRRTMIMLEQSIKAATDAFVFSPNDASTWSTLKSMIENFLHNQWTMGALLGPSPSDAFRVNVGLGSTMTMEDMVQGVMRVMVMVSVVRPAEFNVLTFEQQMQKS